ncbi:FtsX-like permease family protein [bacterium]|jgi:putative ABC transport system permease protein|nr:FtsX-like permease family protein [bacterium]MBT4251044.1 FtsX-like permease family protein [bacterium]MBT4597949.1 FtsX-like permease family protein [bacterium]MBT6753482.1 FtsX-like permease family protein [bacterium]MBT7037991.1 FtsX-like permease family protein [bacterium]
MWLLYTTAGAVKISLKNLIASKVRSFLTVLGIVIGVAAVIIIFSVGLSAQELILDQIRNIGSNLIVVIPGGSNDDGPPAAMFGIAITSLTYDDLEELRKKNKLPDVQAAAGYVMGTVKVESDTEDLTRSFLGTTASYIEVENASLEKGRFFTKDEERNMSKVVVLGSTIAKDLFAGRSPLDKVIEIKDQNFTVIGVFKERGSSAMGVTDQDGSVTVPLKTAQKLILGINHLALIRLKAIDEKSIKPLKANIAATLRDQHDIDNPSDDDFTIRDQATALGLVGDITDVLRYFLLAIGIISLIVGGVGIMNIMLIAVSQRIREIGVRRAVGAKRADILVQFIVESITVSLVGGIIGIILGISIAFLAAVIINSMGYNWQFLLSPFSIITAVLISLGIGLIFGVYPATKASKISPMEALRYD